MGYAQLCVSPKASQNPIFFVLSSQDQSMHITPTGTMHAQLYINWKVLERVIPIYMNDCRKKRKKKTNPPAILFSDE